MTTYRTDPSDRDPQETREWIESLEAVVEATGPDRARYLLRRLLGSARRYGAAPVGSVTTDYVNTIPVTQQPSFPGDSLMEKRIRRIIRWNAVAMVQRANARYHGLGGHLSTYASSASLYEVGFNHFFRGKNAPGGGDLIYFQGHAAPGIYARSFLEGRISMDAMELFRRNCDIGRGLSSYPHPRLMPNYWEFPTVSMGLGPLNAIYQARFMRYLHARGLADTSNRKVWAFLGDGETDEPEALGALSVAAREELSNLIFVINCNLQRLDGPVRGNGKIIQELESVFRGAGWRVIKVIWGPEWDELLANDTEGVLVNKLNETVDGQWQRFTTAPGAYIRQHFFGTDPRLLEGVRHLSDDQLRTLRRGGHSFRKVYAAYFHAMAEPSRPTVILAHTVKGWTLGDGLAGSNITHQKKTLEAVELRAFRDLLELPVPDDQLGDAPFYHPGPNSPEVEYMLERRRALGGCIPERRMQAQVAIELPPDDAFEEFHAGLKQGEASTTMAFARLLSKLLRDRRVGRRIVPIVPDEARTFGMDALFSQVGIYSSRGQLYEPVDKGKVLYYREAKDGQVLEEGITEAGSMASFTAAATSYSAHGQPMIPFYIFYSMFGFQRTGDSIWAAGDALARGFLLGGTAGRTTLAGEGLQHNDGHSHILAATVPSCRAYDVAYAYELAVIIRDGLSRMLVDEENVIYYITLQNENYTMPAMPEGVDEGIRRGIYKLRSAEPGRRHRVQLLGSGSILNEVVRAAELLMHYDVSADIWSVTSYQLLRNDALACERHNRLNAQDDPRVPFITRVLEGHPGPFVAATDYMKLVPDQVARWVPGRFVPLGTDGYGLSDTRPALRRHFEVDAESVVIAALDALCQEGRVSSTAVHDALGEFGVDPAKFDPMSL